MGLFQMSVSGAALILLTVIVRSVALETLPKMTFRFLWGVALFRLLLPVDLPFPAAVPLSVATVAGKFVPRFAGASAALTGTETGFPWFAVWLTGVAALAMFFTASCFRLFLAFRRAAPVECETARLWLEKHRLFRPLSIRQSERVSGPLTFGVLRPVILTPVFIDWTDEKTLPFVLYHEYVHVRRFDAALKLVLAAALCVHWFNPFVWAMYALANRDMELACDEAVVRRFGRDARLPYVAALLNMEERRLGFAPPGFSGNAAKERVRAIMKTRKPAASAYAAACLAALSALTLFALSGSVSRFAPLDAFAVPDGGSDGSARLIASMPVPGGKLKQVEAQVHYDFRGYETVHELFMAPTGKEFGIESGYLLYSGETPPENVVYDRKTETVAFEADGQTFVYDARSWAKN